MNRFISDFSEMSISDANAATNGSSSMRDASPPGRGNPWRGRGGSSVPENASGASFQSQGNESSSLSNEKLFEADSWPEPSGPFERRVGMSTSGSRPVEDRPRHSTFCLFLMALFINIYDYQNYINRCRKNWT